MDNFERRWKLIQENLSMQIQGREPRAVSSGRTLFGIKSTAEQTMDRIAAEMEEECLRKMREERDRKRREASGEK